MGQVQGPLALQNRGTDLVELPARIESKIARCPTSGCWLWTATTTKQGYGVIGGHRNRLAHRVVYELTRGPIPNGMYVCHTCDVPGCVNPAHLWLGTNSDNQLDASAKGRKNSPRGSLSGRAKLTEENVRAILAEPKRNGMQRELAERFGVSKWAINEVRKGRKWRHVER